ncbi:hypothetical protein AVEN_187880-1 [Araneus ventricosus]|uniref:Uncharacterized protein n=1 Tax=Araneus ventricosus TaxID=182803 RepID=A0A4Y2CU65_ARAVE|nr:hypothetical protein AVEN_187880-1 [Araneus ventricosus]
MWTPQEKTQCVAWFIESKSNTQVQSWRLKLKQMGDRPAPCLWRTPPVSINDVYQARMVDRDGGSLPYCVRKFHCTWVSDFVSMNKATY